MSVIRRVVGGAFLFIACASVSSAQSAPARIALINTDAFYDKKVGITKLVNANKQLDIEFESQIKALQADETKLQALAKELENMHKLPTNLLNKDTYSAKQEEGESMQRQIQRKKTELEDAINKRRKVLITPISSDIGSAITEFGNRNGFGAIFDVNKLGESGVLLFLAESGDVTKQFIAYYNARTTPVTTPK